MQASTIKRNLEAVTGRIADAARRAGRAPESVLLIPVTKTVGVGEAQALVDAGVTHLGENRIEVARAKVEALGAKVLWHMVGSVQRRKCRGVVAMFDYVDSVDRIEVAEALERRCAEQEKGLHVLVEVNVSGEEAKHGFEPEDLGRAVEAIGEMPHLQLDGLMTMAPFFDDPELTRPVFAKLRALAENYGLKELSMGMTNDFEVAVEEGATQVRVGTALFAS